MAFPALTTERLLLRRFMDEDLHYVFAGLSNPEVIRYYGVSFTDPESTREQLKWFDDLEKEEKGIWWAICSKNDRQFFGAAGIYNLSREHRKAELGFWLLPEFWGKGYVQEAGDRVLDYAFENLDLHRIEALVESENSASAKTLQKLKFSHEGRMNDFEIKNGSFISLDIFARLKKEQC